MADATEVNIPQALMRRVGTLALNPPLPIAWPNLNFTVPADGKYLRVQHIPNVTQRLHINSDGAHRYLGLLQITVHWPKNRGEIEPRRIAAAIVAHFPCDLRLVEEGDTVRITKRPAAADLMQDDAGTMIPVMVEYECFS